MAKLFGDKLRQIVVLLMFVFLFHGFALCGEPPTPPHNVYSVQIEEGIKVAWHPGSTSPSGYKIYRSTDGAAFNLIATLPGSATSHVDTNYIPDNAYYFRVTAIDVNGAESNPSGITAQSFSSMQLSAFRPINASKAVTGDFNGDGKPDVAVTNGAGCVGKEASQVCGGKVEIYYGGVYNRRGAPDVTLIGETSHGYAMAVADLNKDGFDDLVVGSPFYSPYVYDWPLAGTAKEAGKISVYLGGATFSTTPAFTKNGTYSYANNGNSYYIMLSEQFGYAMANVGDINVDGYPDVAIGVPRGGMDLSGAVKILYGGTSLGTIATVRSPVGSDFMGTTLAAAGDVGMDGFPDIVAGAPNDMQPAYKKKTYLITGGQQPRILVNNVQAIVSDMSFHAEIYLVEGENSITAVAFKDAGQVAASSINISLLTEAGITGVISDQSTGAPLAGVRVTVSDGDPAHVAITDPLGKYTVYGLNTGSPTLFPAGYLLHR